MSNHGVPLIYFSDKRENVLVYLSNAVEKYCRETGFVHHGPWQKWGPYGFTSEGILRLEEYYPNATQETYQGVSGYIYSVDGLSNARPLEGIPFAFTADHPVEVPACQLVPDAYQAILAAVEEGKLALLRYEDMPPKKLAWISQTI